MNIFSERSSITLSTLSLIGVLGCGDSAPLGKGESETSAYDTIDDQQTETGTTGGTRDGDGDGDAGDGDTGDGDTGDGDGEMGDGDGDGDGDEVPTPDQSFIECNMARIKIFNFDWAPADAEYYNLLESVAGLGYESIGTFEGQTTSASLVMPLHLRSDVHYKIEACNDPSHCSISRDCGVLSTLVDAIGYVKASNTGMGDQFGTSVALSVDGTTLAVGAPYEDGADVPQPESGAVYVFVREGTGWTQQAYLKADNLGSGDHFGFSLALSDDGNTLAVGARYEDSTTTGVNSQSSDIEAHDSGAAYVFVRADGAWDQQSYIKAIHSISQNYFGASLAISADGDILAVGAPGENSVNTGVNDGAPIPGAPYAGAVYTYTRQANAWSTGAYIKASNTTAYDQFGTRVVLSSNGQTLITGAPKRADARGAVYVFKNTNGWVQKHYLEASNAFASDHFGAAVALSGDGLTAAVGAWGEDSSAHGIDGDPNNNAASESGAVYVFALANEQASEVAYVKASNGVTTDNFGSALALSDDGAMLVVGAPGEGHSGKGVNPPQDNDASKSFGATYVFGRTNDVWSEASYIKAVNSENNDVFGVSVSLAGDGLTVAVGAIGEDGSGVGPEGEPDLQNNNLSADAGAVYLY